MLAGRATYCASPGEIMAGRREHPLFLGRIAPGRGLCRGRVVPICGFFRVCPAARLHLAALQIGAEGCREPLAASPLRRSAAAGILLA
jgi:hypothetical protein